MGTEVSVRVCVPRRPDGGHRDRLWAYVQRWWRSEAPDFEVVEGEHLDGPFNRSAAVNAAAAGAWDVAIVADADALPGCIVAVRDAVERARSTGRMVLPFQTRHLLDAAGSRELVEFGKAAIAGSGRRAERNHVSSCVVVPRALWDQVGGFDERFVGWGAEDDAFAAACSALAGVDRLPGVVWHLWHPTAPWRDHRSAEYRQALALLARYRTASSPDAMRRLLDEPRTSDQVVVVCLTNGRRDTLAKALHSADEMLSGPIGRRLIVHDSSSGATIGEFPGWDSVQVRGGTYTRAMVAAVEVAIGCGQPWVFWLEDDFTFNEPIDIAAMQQTMVARPELVQLSLKRQAWYDHELAAGGIVEAKPAAFRQCDGYVAHRDYWTQNPMMVRRSFLASTSWPKAPASERRFGDAVFAADLTAEAGIVGCLGDPPLVTHIGTERAGRGY